MPPTVDKLSKERQQSLEAKYNAMKVFDNKWTKTLEECYNSDQLRQQLFNFKTDKVSHDDNLIVIIIILTINLERKNRSSCVHRISISRVGNKRRQVDASFQRQINRRWCALWSSDRQYSKRITYISFLVLICALDC